MKKYMTTYWLDLLTYIIFPFVTFVGVFRVVKSLLYGSFSWSYFLFLILEISFICLYIITFFSSHNRTKNAYICFRIVVIATAIRAAFDFAWTDVNNYGFAISFVGYLVGCVVLWVYPNEIYFKKRKELFKNDNKINLFVFNNKKNKGKK